MSPDLPVQPKEEFHLSCTVKCPKGAKPSFRWFKDDIYVVNTSLTDR